jgi:hypothetical protein
MRTLLRALALTSVLALGAGCYGQFALTKKIHAWNGTITDNKFVHSLVFWAFVIVPVYEVAGLADAIVFNLVEFWSGSNPLAGSGPIQVSAMADGSTVFRTAQHSYRVLPVGEDAVRFWIDDAPGGTARRTADGGVAVADAARGQSFLISAPQVQALLSAAPEAETLAAR